MAKNRIYVDLDSLLDTRLGLFLDLDPVAAKVWLDGNYRMRYSDEFWKISSLVTKEQVKEAWANRSTSLLKRSVRTQVPDLIRNVIASIDWGIQTLIEDNYVELTINTAPYELSDDERIQLQALMEYLFPMVRTIKVINVPLWALNPQQLGSDYDLVILYSFMEWFRTFAERMEQFELGNLNIIAPKIFAELPEESCKQWEALKEADIFDFLVGRMYGRCQLSFESISTFSIALA